MQRKMYFGTRERMTWVNCPAIDVDLSKGRWAVQGGYLNGGAYIRRSLTGHKIYEFSWNLTTQEEIYEIVNYDDGIYGNGLIYFYDPFAMKTNVFPQFWAAPWLAREDGPSFILGKRPDAVATGANAYGYPTQSAVYTLASADEALELWLPIPAGYTLHIGAHGSSTGTASVTVLEDGDTVPDSLTLMPVTLPTLTNAQYSGVRGVTVSFGGVGNLTLAGLVAQVLPTGVSPSTGMFPSGRGHSGCRFPTPVQITGLSAAIDKVSASATLVEVGAWETM